jgi:predicted RNA-binding protein Jag
MEDEQSKVMVFDNDTKEFEGSTVEEAIDKAEKALGVSRETLVIKVVCEEKRGLFGMRGAKLAKIKVRTK